jgi:hypothetical protein
MLNRKPFLTTPCMHNMCTRQFINDLMMLVLAHADGTRLRSPSYFHFRDKFIISFKETIVMVSG